MNGASAEPCVRTINKLSNSITTTIGVNQYFLRILKKRKNSTAIFSLLMRRSQGMG